MIKCIIKHASAIDTIGKLNNQVIDLVYIDPPFNTGKIQSKGFSEHSYADIHKNYKGMLYPVLVELKRVIRKNGLVCVHLDYREVHYVKVWMDEIFGRLSFKGEIIWLSELGAVKKSFWAMKHSTILMYSLGEPKFNQDQVPTLRKLSNPSQQKRLVSVWDYTNSCVDPESTGYPNQKPSAIIKNIILAHTDKGDNVLDCFAGSGTTGAVAYSLGRNSVMCDVNPQAIKVMKTRVPNARIIEK